LEEAAVPELDDAKATTARFYDLLASSYNQIVPFFTYFGEKLVAAAGIGEGDRVLDVATGQGACLVPAAEAVGSSGDVVGIDISEQMIEVLERSIADARLNHVQVRLMDAEALTFEDCSFDVVTCAFALFHLDRVRVLPEFARVLKPGGRVTFSTFDNDALGYPWFGEVVAPFLTADGATAGHGSAGPAHRPGRARCAASRDRFRAGI
jgi:O-methyltransferase/aklanonic acid methyltransferase